MLSFTEFSGLARRGNLVPVTQRVIADLETPVSVLARLKDDPNVFLLESVEAGERFGRWSFIGLTPRAVFTVEGGRAFVTDAAGRRELPAPEGPFMALRSLVKGLRPAAPEGMPAFFGGAVGALGYETVGEFELLPAPKPGLAGPSTVMMITDDIVIFDNIRHTMTLSAAVHIDNFETLEAAYADGVRRVEAMRGRLAMPADLPAPAVQPAPEFRGNCTETSFRAMVERARGHIREGDVIQVVLSQKFTAETDVEPITLYRALRLINPSPYTFFMKMGGLILISSSPETLCRVEGSGRALLRPIAGTRRRGTTPEEDQANEKSLLADPKERAEHLMLVDLARNDLGRIAAPGTVKPTSFMTIERYSHVMHIVSTVEGDLAPGNDAFDLVRSAFPAGTLSGAPKIRAMEIINTLEPEPRGMYGGAAGYFSYDGAMDLAITIRTIVMRGRKIGIQSGAGIVYDSDPAAEYQETKSKAAAMMKAVDLAARGLAL